MRRMRLVIDRDRLPEGDETPAIRFGPITFMQIGDLVLFDECAVPFHHRDREEAEECEAKAEEG